MVAKGAIVADLSGVTRAPDAKSGCVHSADSIGLEDFFGRIALR
jgi:hypothetical protein